MEGRQVFDTKNSVSVDFGALEVGSLGGGETDGWGKTAKVEDFAGFEGELPVPGKVDVAWVGDEIEFAQNFIGGKAFPFGVAETSQADELVFERFEALAVVENTDAKNPVGSFYLECWNGLHNGQQVRVQIGVGQAEGRERFPGAEIGQDMAMRSRAPIINKAKFVGEQEAFEAGTLGSKGGAVQGLINVCCVFRL